jgi:Uma2 family endonuclease
MSSVTDTTLTAAEYLSTSDQRPRRTELINGEVMVNNPTIRHQKIVRYVEFALEEWTRSKPGRGVSPGQVDVRFDNDSVLAPDVLWASHGRIPADGTHLEIVPELVVEVRSPSTWRYDMTVKFRKYEEAGVLEVWMIDTASNTVLVYRRSSASSPVFDVAIELGTGEELKSPQLEDFALDISSLFAR